MATQKLLHFYCTRNDLISIGSMIDEGERFKYVSMEGHSRQDLKLYRKIENLPKLGEAQHQNAIANVSYLVINKECDVHYRRSPGGTFLLDQEENEQSVIFQPGGLFGDGILLYGRIGTIHGRSPASMNIYKLFSKNIRNNCRKFGSYYVGREAADLARKGVRLTISAQSPRSFDLELP